MVSFEEEGAITAKIIDLGLAKIVEESGAQTTISAMGAFAGTPEFASPEQISEGRLISVRISTPWVFRFGRCLLVRCHLEAPSLS